MNLLSYLENIRIPTALVTAPTTKIVDIQAGMKTNMKTLGLPGIDHPNIAYIEKYILAKGIVADIMSIAGTIAMLIIIWGGFQMLFADESKKEAGKKAIQYSLSGLLIMIFAYSIVKLVLSLL